MPRFVIGVLPCVMAFFISSTAKADGRWDYRVDVTTSTHLFGYRPAKILSDDGAGTFVASQNPSMRTEVRGRLRIVGEWLELDLEPYTVIPAEMIRVELGGLEVSLVAPITSWAKVGFYHHSSHNFSDSSYGWGIDLNAFVLDLRLYEGAAPLFGDEGRYRFRFLGHGYLRGRASPYVLTSSASVAASDIGNTAWRGGLLFEGVHPGGLAECSVTAASDAAIPSSVTAACSLAIKIGPRFFGALGDHVYAGPFVGYSRNFSRTDAFGTDSFYGGVRVDLLFAESADRPRDR
ncbi:MAG: hypothetical protein RL272_1352 [Candidatus Parcubacteria bacterium]|jgi:hypothetical protein